MMSALSIVGVSKSFIAHLREGLVLRVVSNLSFDVAEGECVVLGGPSGTGKSSVLKMVYGNYRVDSGRIAVATDTGVIDVASADPRAILALRKGYVGYVSQFLRAVPRVPAIDVVAESAAVAGMPRDAARRGAADLLARLNVPERLWMLPPATFSGGEQQRVNIARGLLPPHRLLLMDEPTASLDARNRAVVVDLMREKKAAGVAVLGVFHDEDVREAIADRHVDITAFADRTQEAAA